jgi:uncharacterized protein
MKKIITTFLLVVIPFVIKAQTDNKITIGTIEHLNSKILNEERELRIYVPNNNSVASNQKYPVLYLLDGEAHFNSVVGMMEQLCTNGNMVVPEMIIVGISNTDRIRDLSPTHIKEDLPAMDSIAAKNTGGNENLFAFMEKELFPYIENKYKTVRYRMLIGHSLGGLTVINALVNHTNLFNAYIAIDPSMWWDKERFLEDCKTKLTQKSFKNVDLYLGIANTMEAGMSITTVTKDTSENSRHIRSILALDKHLKGNPQNQLHYKSKYYEADSHNSVPLITEYDAVRFFFDFYKFDITMEDFESTDLAFPKKIEKHFEMVSNRMGYKVSPNEGLINFLGYESLKQKKMEQSEYLFKMNVKNYPESFNVYDSLGDYYVAIDDKPNAILNFKKALDLGGSPESKQKLENLQKP